MGIGNETFKKNNFVFKVSVSKTDALDNIEHNNVLIDCGATTHVICDCEEIIRIKGNFDSKNHIIELADCFRQRNVIIARRDASLWDSTNLNHILIAFQ